MPIVASDLVLYVTANHPTDDVGTSGGAIDATRRPEFTQFAAPARIAIISDGADTRVATLVFRDGTGAIVTETPSLNGTSEVLSTATAERVLSVTLGATSGSRTVSVKEGTGGTVRGTIPINEVGFTACFISSASAAGAVHRYEKLFWKNKHGSLTLNSATVTLTSDPSARIKIGLAATKGDSASVANRLAAPGGISFVDDNVAINVPTGVLASGETIGEWVDQGLLSNDAPFKSVFVSQMAGTSS